MLEIMKTARRKFLRQIALVPGAVFAPWENLFVNNFLQEAPYKMEMLRRNVGIFTERGGTVGYLLSADGIAVVDTQFPDQARNLIGEIRKRTDKKIDLLINTHHHGDHTAGNIAFKGLILGSVAHENSRRNQERVAKSQGTTDQQLFPETVYKSKWSKKIGNENIVMRYFGPGHTDGDSVVHFENANVAHVGDLIFNRRHPFVDRSAGASIRSWINVLASIQAEYDNDTLFIFGHAGTGFPVTGNKNDLKAMQNYLQRLLDSVASKVKKGESMENVLQMIEIPGATEWKGDGIQRPLTAAYEELKSE